MSLLYLTDSLEKVGLLLLIATCLLFLKLPYRGNFRLLHNFVHVVLPLPLPVPVHLDKPGIFLYYIFSQPQQEIFLYYIFSQP